MTVRQKILELLSDWQPHSREELFACLVDELSGIANIGFHVTMLRKHLRPKRVGVLCDESSGNPTYQLVWLFNPVEPSATSRYLSTQI